MHFFCQSGTKATGAEALADASLEAVEAALQARPMCRDCPDCPKQCICDVDLAAPPRESVDMMPGILNSQDFGTTADTLIRRMQGILVFGNQGFGVWN